MLLQHDGDEEEEEEEQPHGSTIARPPENNRNGTYFSAFKRVASRPLRPTSLSLIVHSGTLQSSNTS